MWVIVAFSCVLTFWTIFTNFLTKLKTRTNFLQIKIKFQIKLSYFSTDLTCANRFGTEYSHFLKCFWFFDFLFVDTVNYFIFLLIFRVGTNMLEKTSKVGGSTESELLFSMILSTYWIKSKNFFSFWAVAIHRQEAMLDKF